MSDLAYYCIIGLVILVGYSAATMVCRMAKFLWGLTGHIQKPQSLIDEEIKKNRIKRYYDGALQ